MNITCLTTGYPRHEHDHYGIFVFKSMASLSECKVTVLVPTAKGLPAREQTGNISVKRFSYFWPKQFQNLAYQHEGIVNTVKNRVTAKLLLPFFLFCFLIKSLSSIRKCDLVHAQWLPTAFIAWLGARMFRKPLVVTARGADMRFATQSSWGKRFTAWMVNHAQATLSVNEEFSRFLSKLAKDPQKHRVFYHPNGVDQKIFQPMDPSHAIKTIAIPTPFFLAVGHLSPVKGFDVLIEAFSVTKPAHLYILGEGTLEKELKDQVASLGLHDFVHFLGNRPQSKLPLWYNACEALIIPSRQEGRPNVLLEALACQTVVLASGLPGIHEMDPAEEVISCTEPGSVEGLRELLLRFGREKAAFRKRAQKGPELLRLKELTWEAHGRKLMEIYQSVLPN